MGPSDGQPADTPKLYRQLADWWPILSHPDEYVDEAAVYRRLFETAIDPPPRTMLELGSGGGNNASHLKAHFDLTLVDLSPDMLAVSRRLNPECEHLEGDMRTVRLGRQFDAVFIHDAVMYLTTETDLRLAFETAFVHCRPGGVALFMPDCVRETYRPYTDHGGSDADGRALRYLEWCYDPDPTDTTVITDFVYLLRDESGAVRTVYDRHVDGLFSRAVWLRLLDEVGFLARPVPVNLSELPEGGEAFVALKPAR